MPAGTRRRYTEEYKMEAMQLVRESTCLVTVLAMKLRISDYVVDCRRSKHQHAETHGTTRAAQPHRGRGARA
jgi:transposase-like protein